MRDIFKFSLVLSIAAFVLGGPVQAQDTFTMKVGIVVQNDPLHESTKLVLWNAAQLGAGEQL